MRACSVAAQLCVLREIVGFLVLEKVVVLALGLWIQHRTIFLQTVTTWSMVPLLLLSPSMVASTSKQQHNIKIHHEKAHKHQLRVSGQSRSQSCTAELSMFDEVDNIPASDCLSDKSGIRLLLLPPCVESDSPWPTSVRAPASTADSERFRDFMYSAASHPAPSVR